MASRKPLIDADDEVRELTAEDMAKFRPAAEVLPLSLRKKLGVRGPQKAPLNNHRLKPEGLNYGLKVRIRVA